jgi:teichuronic acid biosynthesis glycosyltransferase TuaC
MINNIEPIRVLMCGPIASTGGVSTHTVNLIKYLKKEGVIVEFLNFSSGDESIKSNIKKIYKRTLGFFIYALTHNNDYDIIHLQVSGGIFSFISAIAGNLLYIITQKKYVITFHYSKTVSFVNCHQYLFKFSLNYSDKFIVVSNSQKRVLDPLINNKDKIIVIPNGFDTEKFKVMDIGFAREQLNLELNKYILLNIANLVEKKGQIFLLEAMNILVNKQNQRNLFCVIIGRGHLYSKFKNKIAEYQLEDYIRLIGEVELSELILYLNSCNLFVLPSIYESFGIVQIEAMACGKPVVATLNGGSEDIISSEDYGYLCPPRDADALSKSILKAINSNWNNSKISNYAQRFSWSNIAYATLCVYNDLLTCQKDDS